MAYVKFVTAAFSAAYPSLDKPDTTSAYPSNAYEVTALLQQDDTDTLKALQEAINQAAKAEWPNANPDDYKSPLRNLEDGGIKVKFKSKSKPPMQDSGGNRLPDDVKIYGGDLIRVAGSAKAYNVGPQKGVTLYLNNVRLVEKRATGSDDFGGPEDGFVVGQSGSEEEVF